MSPHVDRPTSMSGTRLPVIESLTPHIRKPSRCLPPLASAAFLFVLLLFATTPALAQLGATITGVLADPSGAAVVDASLALTSEETGVMLMTVKSDAGGNFAFLAV